MNERDAIIQEITSIIGAGDVFVDDPDAVAKNIVDTLHDRRSAPTWFAKEVREQAVQYLTALYGTDWVYQAPELHENLLVRWVRYVADGALPMAEKTMDDIEEIAVRLKNTGAGL